MDKLILDKKTEYWMLYAWRGRFLEPKSKMQFKISKVVLGLNTQHLSVSAFSRGKAIANFHGGTHNCFGKDAYEKRSKIAQEKFHKEFSLNTVWDNSEDTLYYGFFESKELAEKYLVDSGLLTKCIKDAQSSLQKHQQKYFSSVKYLTEIVQFSNLLTGVPFQG